MTHILLFCIAEEAKPFVHKVLDVKLEGCGIFYLVETHTCPSRSKEFKQELEDDETFETEFIGASEQDCQKWALEKQYQVNFIEQNIIAIADARSARDSTISIQSYNDGTPLEFGRYGVLPREHDTWYDFRIDHKKATEVFISLQEGDQEIVYPVYFGHKEELTDEHGVFDVDKAERFVEGEDPAMFEF
ncbi:hypothetical protein G7Y89_g6618 [Cudoniella acicularis]|uniref:Uncharacterized protein n=1 Tax=Cudoniella acicularis TaxID=354080 RepID=A0A8H4RK40_9HELO|nr:hypothetical protein G7Y89_g6618 [Cudoniella acicularis]